MIVRCAEIPGYFKITVVAGCGNKGGQWSRGVSKGGGEGGGSDSKVCVLAAARRRAGEASRWCVDRCSASPLPSIECQTLRGRPPPISRLFSWNRGRIVVVIDGISRATPCFATLRLVASISTGTS